MNVKTIWTIALVLAAIVIAAGCAKEQPASKTEGRRSHPTRHAGSRPGRSREKSATPSPSQNRPSRRPAPKGRPIRGENAQTGGPG